MTNKQAIKILKAMIKPFMGMDIDPQIKEAVDMAVTALKKNTVVLKNNTIKTNAISSKYIPRGIMK